MKTLFTTLVAATLLTSSFNSAAITTTIADVGPNYDILLGSTTLGNSSAAGEQAWVESVLGFDVTYTQLTEAESGGDIVGNWISVGNIAGDYAFELTPYNPEYFVVKVGAGKNDPVFTHYLFDNAISMEWAFLNVNDSFGEGVVIKNIGKVSHVGLADCVGEECGSDRNLVPIPAAAWLFGSGLIGLVAVGRRRNV